MSARFSGTILPCASCCCTVLFCSAPKATPPPQCPVILILIKHFPLPCFTSHCSDLLQLCGVLAQHPEVAAHYSPSLRQLLLWGSSDDPGQSGVVRGLWAWVAQAGGCLVRKQASQACAAPFELFLKQHLRRAWLQCSLLAHAFQHDAWSLSFTCLVATLDGFPLCRGTPWMLTQQLSWQPC